MTSETNQAQIRALSETQFASTRGRRTRKRVETAKAALLYFLTGALVLFGAIALARADDAEVYGPRRVKVELTPSVGLSAGIRRDAPSEAPKPVRSAPSEDRVAEPIAEADAPAAPSALAVAEAEEFGAPVALATQESTSGKVLVEKLDSLQENADEPREKPQSDAGNEDKDIVKEILALAGELAALVPVEEGEETEEPGVAEDALDALDEALLGEEEYEEEYEGESTEVVETALEDEEEGFAFAYSNPTLSAPTAPASDFSALGLNRFEPVGPALKPIVEFQPIQYPTSAAPTVAPSAPAVPKVAMVPTTPVPSPSAIPYSAPVALPRSTPTSGSLDDNFRAKPELRLNGKVGGQTYRSLDEPSFMNEAPKAKTNGVPTNLTTPPRFGGRERFSESKPAKKHPIAQVSAVVRANVEPDASYEQEEGVLFSTGTASAAPAPVPVVPVAETNQARRESAPAREIAASTPLREATPSEPFVPENDRKLFPRPFKRLRERRLLNAPTPPSAETLEVEDRVVLAKEPLLTRESAALPPRMVEPSARYGEEVVPGGDEPATRSELAALREEAKGFAWTKGPLKITPYGFLNLSVSNDSQRAIPGDYILYAQSADVDDSSAFTIDARTSRIGLKIEGPRIDALHADLGGCAEFDFQGYPNGSKNKGGVQLRRAYAELVDKQNDRRLLAGQDWEIISPGAPQMLNYLPAAFVGDIQYRRAQLRYEQGYSTSGDCRILAQIAACDNVLGDYTSTAGVNAASSGWPIIEGRIASELFKESFNGTPIVVGLSGHIGEQYYRFSPIAGVPMCSTTERFAVRTWSACVDFSTPLGGIHKFSGEFYSGTNLSSFCGGINQGIDLYRRDSIDDQGGWLSIHSDWTKKFATNVGYGCDKPKQEDLVGTTTPSGGFATSRTKNEVYFVNGIYNWTPNFMTGLEVGYYRTGYQKADVTGSVPVFYDMKAGKDLRTEFVTRLTF